MDKNAKRKRAEKAKAEEAALNRTLCWVTGGAVLEFLLLLLTRYWSYYTGAEVSLRLALTTVVKILAVAALVCAAGGAFWWSSARKSGKGGNLPGSLCLFMVGVSLGCFATWFGSDPGLRLMTYVVPVVVVLALIYYLYQHEFFLIASQSSLALLGIWLCGRLSEGGKAWMAYAYVAVAAVLLLAAAFLCRKAQGEQGTVELAGRQMKMFGKDANYGLLYAGAVIALVSLIVAAIGISPAVLYAVVVAWLLIMAVYYTVKLM